MVAECLTQTDWGAANATAGDANPRGVAIKIRATSGDVDLVTHSFNGVPVATSDECAVFLRAIGGSGSGVAHPTPTDQCLAGHPIAKAFVTSQPPPPESDATIAYVGVNSVTFINASGRSAFVRYRLVPRAGEHYLTPDGVKTKGPDYLIPELTQRLTRAPGIDTATLFLPGTAHPGIDRADPMLTLRNNAYPISFKKRQ